MEKGHNDVESTEMHFEDDKILVDKNKKRTVKTRAQIEALENFYNEHKYPTEMMKLELAESTGLTEKQISGWFCHRRLKDKKLYFGSLAGMQDHSSGVVQDLGSGHRQDSCGSNKQGDRNFDTREVESGRFILPEHSAVELTYSGNYNSMDDALSGGSSSMRNIPNSHKENHFDMATSRYLPPKFPIDVPSARPRSGPSGYLKVKRPVENPAITAVKRQLGNLYKEDGPALGVEFDPLPPAAFESTPDLVDETHCAGEGVSSASPRISKIHQHLKFGKGCEYGSSISSVGSKMDIASFKVPQGSDVPDYYGHQKFKQNSSPSYYSWRSPEMPTRDVSGSDIRDDFGMRYRHGVEDMRVSSVSSNCHRQLIRGKFRVDSCRKNLQGENMENHSANLSIKGYECHRSADKMPRQIAKDGKIYAGRSTTNGKHVAIPYKNDFTASKRTWDGVPPQQPFMKKQLVATNHVRTYQGAIRSGAIPQRPSSISEEEEEEEEGSAETSC